MRIPFIAVAVALLSGCATMPPIQTASGQPEITLQNVDAACVRSRILNHLVDERWSVKSNNETQIVAGKPSQNFAANLLLSTGASGAPEDRVTFLFIGLPNNGMRIVASEQYVSNAGTAFEMATPVGQSQAVEDQFLMSRDRAQANCGKN